MCGSIIRVICLCSAVLAAPQGYSYNQQQNGFSIGLSDFNDNSLLDTTAKNYESNGFLQQTVNSINVQQPLVSGQTSATHHSQFSSGPSFYNLPTSTQQNFAFGGIQQEQQEQQAQTILPTSFAAQHQPYHGFQQQYQQYPAPSTVTKDIYVHVAPEETQDQQYQQHVLPPPPPRKHYRIVFIKAPAPSSNKAPVRVQQAQTEERTIIYVLTKKADPLDFQAAIQEIQPKQPSKPEVYFIKYKTKEEAQHAQRTIQAQYEQLGGTSQVSDEGIAPVASVVGALDGNRAKVSLDFSSGSAQAGSSASASSSKLSGLASAPAAAHAHRYLPSIAKL